MQESSRSSLCPYPHPNVIGINLLVTSGDEPSRTLTFFKSTAPVVNIGRMPSTRAPQADDDTAWLRCAVVSRKHAKIVFSDSGQVYIVDLCSHHGTQILKPGDTISRTIEPESPTSLGDGDVITFGKSVGKDTSVVRPVSARIKFLLHSRSTPDVFDVDLADESLDFPYKASPAKSSTGRYGVAYALSVSSASSSDIEEVSGPEILPSRPSSHGDLEVISRRGLGLLKHILPPISFPTTPSRSPSALRDAHDINDDEVIIVDEEHRTNSHAVSHHTDLSLLPSPITADPITLPPVNRNDSIFETEPNVIGAWPGSPVSPMSQQESLDLLWEPMLFPEICEVSRDLSQMLDIENRDAPIEVDLDIEEVDGPGRSRSPSFFEDNDCQDEHTSDANPSSIKQDGVMADIDRNSELKEEVSKIKASVDQVFHNVQTLRYSKRKAASHIHRAEKKLENLDKRVENIDSLCSSHSNRISDMMEAEASRMAAIIAKRGDEETKDAALNALLEEMRVFREQTFKQIAEEIIALKAAREEALTTIKDLAAQVQAQTLQTSSALKRKRSEDAIDDGNEQDLPPRRIKRTRKHIVSKVLRTAGVFTVGAVATWSALAYS